MGNNVYLYSRVSTDLQSTQQQERTAYEWLKHHNMKVSKVVSDEGISGGVSYKDRRLGRELLPIMVAGDTLIVSEISRLGRSMFDVSTLIHTELKPRKIRLIVVSMGIDLRCDKMTAIDELILNNFSFAAQLEKQLISERTLSALQVKRQKGVKLGAASEKYKQTRNNKTNEQKEIENMKRGEMKRLHFQESRDTQTFLRVLRKVFPLATKAEQPDKWNWQDINVIGDNKANIIAEMKDYKEFDSEGKLFRKWDLNKDPHDRQQVMKLAAYIQRVRRSYIGS